ncbi:MAG TPA: nuclear transport factor 2 family protein [Solirubrobacteraceae bacterium]|nr:nuclear transport factor 2 family protein [Solirubrobacteraceae bacterium]
MSEQDVELVGRLYEGERELVGLQREGGDLCGHPWLELWHAECMLEDIAEAPDRNSYRGREGVARYFTDAFEEVWDEWRFTPIEIVEAGEGVLAVVDLVARSKSGVEVTIRLYQVFRTRDGLIAFATGSADRDEALRALDPGGRSAL